MISVSGLSKVYPTRSGEKQVLSDVNFKLDMGERLGILGRNGAGKSTLIRLVSGAERPTSGTIRRDMSVSWPLAFGGAFQPQLTGIDNLRFISRVYDQDFERNLAFVEDFAELGAYLREPVRSYSSGMRARLAFAISMIIEFDCFLIDEIAAVGDARFHERCNYELFERRGDRAMIIVSHDSGYIRNHCNRWAVLFDSKFTTYSDFDAAYDCFVEQIGVRKLVPAAPLSFKRRTASIDALSRIALADEHYMLLAQRGDHARDRGQWEEAEAAYAEALSLHPYGPGYWVQFGHVTRAQGKRVRAELAYRTACALGEPLRDLRAFLQTLGDENGASLDWLPLEPDDGPLALQPVGYPDLALLMRAFDGDAPTDEQRALDLLRTHRTLGELTEQLVADLAQGASHPSNYERLFEPLTVVPGSATPYSDWLADLTRLTGADHAKIKQTILSCDADNFPSLLQIISGGGAFSDWDNLDVINTGIKRRSLCA